jgi:nucleotidyltransferase AbiEii toxin of type IV toxin-antitoxin system
MAETVPLGLPSWERTMRAVDKVKDRLLRATAALEKAGVPYAVAGGNAVAAWVGQVDSSAVRFTQDVDLLLRREDLDAAKIALEPAGFYYRHSARFDMFLDGPNAKARDAVHIVFAGEKVRPAYALPAPNVSEAAESDAFRVLQLEALVRMKLTSFRDKDKTHLRDMMDVRLIDESWVKRMPEPLASRLQSLIDHPEG